MSCEYCYMPTRYHDGKHWKQKYGDQGCITHSDDGKPLIAVWNENEPARSLLLVRDITYCPFCGGQIEIVDRINEIYNHRKVKKENGS